MNPLYEEIAEKLLSTNDIVVLKDENSFRLLAIYLNELINNDFEYLLTILYRIDVDEKRLRALLASQPGENAGELIAHLIIERQEQKIKSREQFKPPTNIPEEEKW